MCVCARACVCVCTWMGGSHNNEHGPISLCVPVSVSASVSLCLSVCVDLCVDGGMNMWTCGRGDEYKTHCDVQGTTLTLTLTLTLTPKP